MYSSTSTVYLPIILKITDPTRSTGLNDFFHDMNNASEYRMVFFHELSDQSFYPL